MRAAIAAIAGVAALLFSAAVPAEQSLVAVATNFSALATQLAEDFEAESGHLIELAAGSTGKLYAQIMNGAPFDLLLAADQARPKLLEADLLGVSGSRRTYAIGALSLWQPGAGATAADAATALRAGDFRSLAMANPRLAPYGQAAAEVLASLGLMESLSARIVLGENIAQAYALVASGNAPIGFVAEPQLAQLNESTEGRVWPVPEELHSPIRQDLVMLRRGANNPAARGFADYLLGASARQRIKAAGYRVE